MMVKVLGGIQVPGGCYSKLHSGAYHYCFALSSTYTDSPREAITTNFALMLTDIKEFNKAAEIHGRLTMGTNGELIHLQGSAKGCIDTVEYDIGLGEVGVELCLKGGIIFEPYKSVVGKLELYAAVYFEVFQHRLSIKLLVGGETNARGDYIDDAMRFTELAGRVYVRTPGIISLMSADIITTTRPRGT
jgi:hypothetical protein